MCEANVYEKTGKHILGPFIAAYCQWIHRQREKLGLDEIVFLARDGYLIRQVYRKLYPDENTYYIRISRKALRKPYVDSCLEYLDYIKIIPFFRKYTIRDFLMSIYSDEDMIPALPFDLNYAVKYNELPEDGVFQEAYGMIKKHVMTQGHEQKKLLLEYLRKNGIESGKKIGLIERTFKGTSQYMLEQILGQEMEVRFVGLFFYGNSIARERLPGRFKSFLEGEIRRNNIIFYEEGILTERLMFESCGSVLGYKKNGNEVEPVMERNEEERNDAIILEIQKKALQYADEVKRKNITVDKKKAVAGMLKLLKHPDAKTAGVLGRIEDDNIKNHNISLACTRPYNQYLKSPEYLCRDIKASLWRQGFLVQLPFGSVLREIYNICFALKYIGEG